jgi:hypothetical protein
VSSFVPSVRIELAPGGGCTVGPCEDWFIGAGCVDANCVDGDGREGYLLVALPAAALPTFEAEEPMVSSIELMLQGNKLVVVVSLKS